ncbi:MAG: hypothetical protein MPW15_09440 [Candidatus Manganitrophus sp.]|nr:hypothetical protein [Candidatus Manganitrophus sp.]
MSSTSRYCSANLIEQFNQKIGPIDRPPQGNLKGGRRFLKLRRKIGQADIDVHPDAHHQGGDCSPLTSDSNKMPANFLSS